MKKNFKTYLFIFVVFFFIDIIFYWRLWDTFFQQDEWGLFGRAILHSTQFPQSIFSFSGAHFHPMGNLVWLILYKVFGINAFYYGILAIVIHTLVGSFSFYFFKIFTKNTYVSLLLAFIFLISYPTKQVVVWYAANPYIIPSIFGILLFFVYLNSKHKSKNLSVKSIFILALIWIFSLLFREEAAVLVVLFPLYIYLFWGNTLFYKLKKKIFLLDALIVFLLGVRYVFEKFIGDNIVYEQGNLTQMWMYNFVLGPAKMLIQNFVALEQLWDFARRYNNFAFPERITDGLIVESAIFELIIMFLLIPVVFVLGYVLPRMNVRERKILLFAIIWIVLSTMIVGLQSRRLFTLESRYLYLGSIGVLLFVYVIAAAYHRTKIISKAKLTGIVLLVASVFVCYSFIQNRQVMNTFYIPNAIERTQILKQFVSIRSTIPKQVVFYVECKQEDDCIPNGLVLPFQSGVGHMLMVIYAQQNEAAYAPFFEDFYLWDWEEQDYKEIGGYGFGYYREKERLYQDAGEGKFLPSDVIGFSYDRSENKLYEITETVRKDILNSVQLQRNYESQN